MLGDPTFRHWRAGLCLCLMTVPVWGAGFIVDGDGDGVPFEIDECPYTRPGQPVDARGCSDLPDADEDGIPDVDDRCPVSAVGASIDPDGCAIDGDGDGIPDGIDQCPGTPISTVPGSTGCSAAQRLALGEPRVIVGRPVTGRPMPSPDRAVAAAPDRLNTQAQADVSSAFHDESSVAMQATKPAAPEAGQSLHYRVWRLCQLRWRRLGRALSVNRLAFQGVWRRWVVVNRRFSPRSAVSCGESTRPHRIDRSRRLRAVF